MTGMLVSALTALAMLIMSLIIIHFSSDEPNRKK